MKINIYLIENVININNNLINIILVYLYISIKIYIFFLRKKSIRSNSLRRNLHDLFPPHSILFYRFVWKKNQKKSFFRFGCRYIYIYILGNNIDQKNMGESGLMESYAGR